MYNFKDNFCSIKIINGNYKNVFKLSLSVWLKFLFNFYYKLLKKKWEQ